MRRRRASLGVRLLAVVALLSTATVLVVAGLTLALLVLPWSLVSGTLGHSVDFVTMLHIGVLTSTVALVGSVLGAGLEEDADLAEALFGGSDDARPAPPVGVP